MKNLLVIFTLAAVVLWALPGGASRPSGQSVGNAGGIYPLVRDSDGTYWHDVDRDRVKDADEPYIIAGGESEFYRLQYLTDLADKTVVNGGTPTYHYFSSEAQGNAVGSDANHCLSWANACQSLSKATTECGNGDICVFDSGDTWSVDNGFLDDGLQTVPSCTNVDDEDGPCIIFESSTPGDGNEAIFDCDNYQGAGGGENEILEVKPGSDDDTGWVVFSNIKVIDDRDAFATGCQSDIYSSWDEGRLMVINTDVDATMDANNQPFTPHEQSQNILLNSKMRIDDNSNGDTQIVGTSLPETTQNTIMIGHEILMNEHDGMHGILFISGTNNNITSNFVFGGHQVLGTPNVGGGAQLYFSADSDSSTMNLTVFRSVFARRINTAGSVFIVTDNGTSNTNTINLYDTSFIGGKYPILIDSLLDDASTFTFNGSGVYSGPGATNQAGSPIYIYATSDDSDELQFDITCSKLDTYGYLIAMLGGLSKTQYSQVQVEALDRGWTNFFTHQRTRACKEPYVITFPVDIPSWVLGGDAISALVLEGQGAP